jgi:histidyl-tRNA synthetase
VLALDAEGLQLPVAPTCEVFFVPLGEAAKRRSALLVAELRRAGVAADMAYGDRGMKGAMKGADRSGASYAVVLGDRDLEAGEAQVKDLRAHDQSGVPLDDLISTLKGKLL